MGTGLLFLSIGDVARIFSIQDVHIDPAVLHFYGNNSFRELLGER